MRKGDRTPQLEKEAGKPSKASATNMKNRDKEQENVRIMATVEKRMLQIKDLVSQLQRFGHIA